MSEVEGMKVGQVRAELALAVSGSDVDVILEHVLSREIAWLRAHDGDAISHESHERARRLVARRVGGEPLAYIVGSAGFYRREFLVDSRVLIPRPETEHLVEEAIAHLRGREAPRVLDVGTGSGAIACTIAAEVPNAVVDAVDISENALDVARENARRLNVRVTFHRGDLVAPIADRTYDVIVANLPYVPTGEGDESLRYEPQVALDAGPDGLAYYRRLFVRVPPLLVPGGLVLAEGAPPIATGLLALARSAFPQARASVERDYGGRERYVKVTAPG